MALYDRNCPYYRNAVSQRQTPIRDANAGFPCATCGQTLRTARTSLRLICAATLVNAFGIQFFFGFRGLTGILTALIASIPLTFIALAAWGLFFSPRLEPFPRQKP